MEKIFAQRDSGVITHDSTASIQASTVVPVTAASGSSHSGAAAQAAAGARVSSPALRAARITDPAQFGRVAVVMGGSSAEREVSLDSGRNVLAALIARGVDAHAIDGIPALLDALRAGHFARVFNILHGQHGGGEDGVLQGALESLHIPYTGSGVLGSALSMDKTRSKRVWQSLGLPTPAFVPLPRGADVHAAAREIGFPLIVKPACEGSSVGVTRVFEEKDLDAAVALAEKYPGDMLMEALIEGDELTVGILGRQVLPSIHIVPKGAFYDYNAKYIAEDTRYICPGLEGEVEAALRALSLEAFDALGCHGWGRVDLMRDRQGRDWLLEVNTAPGMTSHSLVPKAAAVAGIDYQELCWRVLETSMHREHGAGASPSFSADSTGGSS
ncbi:D-alanine--D-alanine ligase [Dyella jejuensis]|uniref:D-alanine--D-alanine ligase n=1 Tax=Dyella jejuensis TaxID=1432009 RepID=UPI00384B9946